MKHIKQSPREAFTLVEIASILGFLSIVLLITTKLFVMAGDVHGRALEAAVRHRTLSVLIDRIHRDVSRAEKVQGDDKQVDLIQSQQIIRYSQDGQSFRRQVIESDKIVGRETVQLPSDVTWSWKLIPAGDERSVSVLEMLFRSSEGEATEGADKKRIWLRSVARVGVDIGSWQAPKEKS